jgi:Rrf2 family protein
MQITRAGEYGVLGLMNLARRAPSGVSMIEEVSRAEKIPKSFLAKIFQDLARGGLVRSNRGAGGGFALARRPSQITVLEIIEAIEGEIVFQRCKLAKPDCGHTGGCALCGLYERAQDGVKEVLSRTTLRALVSQQKNIAAGPGRARRPRRRPASALARGA